MQAGRGREIFRELSRKGVGWLRFDAESPSIGQDMFPVVVAILFKEAGRWG